jgi:hypothetical protein
MTTAADEMNILVISLSDPKLLTLLLCLLQYLKVPMLKEWSQWQVATVPNLGRESMITAG